MYRATNLIAEDLEKLLADSEMFKDIRIAAVSGYQTLFKLHSNLTRFPAAIVCIGGGSLKDTNSVRELDAGIIIIDKFKSSSVNKAQGVWDILDSTINLLTSGVNRAALNINGVVFLPQNFQAVDLSGSNCAYMLEIQVLAPKQ